MSIRGISASTLLMCLVWVFCCSQAVADESAPPASAEKKAASASDKAGESTQTKPPVRTGSVQKALRRLFTIPRPSTRPAGDRDAPGSGIESSRLGLQHTDAIRDSVSSVPIGGQTTPHRLGLQHSDAIRDSVSSLPIGGQTTPNRLGLQHTDAIRDSVSSLPIGAETRDTTKAEPGAYADRYAPLLIGPGLYYYPRRRLPFNERRWSNYLYFDGQPSRYGYGMNDYFGDDYAGDIYRFGFNRGYDTGRFDKVTTERQERVLAHARGHLERGLTHLHEGRYREAADAFKLAADTNHGDPAARLYAAHALFATGRYRDAVKYLRRAFELQPKIVFLDFDMRDDYGKRADFDKQVEALERALGRFPRNLDRLIVLGYVRYYSNQRDQAYEPLAKAHEVDRRDRLVLRLLENCRPPDVMLDEKATDKTTDSKSN